MFVMDVSCDKSSVALSVIDRDIPQHNLIWDKTDSVIAQLISAT